MNGLRSLAGQLVATRRSRLVLLLLVTTLAISALAFRAAMSSSSLSYYTTPEEFRQVLDAEGKRWRVGGRVVAGSIEERAGRPVRFDIVGEAGERMAVDYDGIVPNLFGPHAFVVVEGTAVGADRIEASSVVIKHENEFFADTPPEDSPSRRLIPTPAE